jgi:predicted AAA+ superfamily ATPase
MPSFTRPCEARLRRRLAGPRRFIQVVAGPRQVGKTTLVRQVLGGWGDRAVFVSADEPALKGREWIAQQWETARLRAAGRRAARMVLAIDEVQKIPGWSETVKRLWDEDTATRIPLKVVLLGSAPLLVQQGLTESLAGRFEVLHMPHWSYAEMRDAFGFDVEEHIFFGGYPGAASLTGDPSRWARYINDSLIETTISRDVLLLTRVDKPALLRRLFELACRYSGQIVAYTKLLGQLHDAGNTTTLAHYLDLLSGAGMVTGLQKYSGSAVRRRGSIPRFQVLNTALMTAASGLTPEVARGDREFRGRLIESAVGAHLANAAASGIGELFYWRDGNREVDFVVRSGRALTAIEVKSGRSREALSGLAAFSEAYKVKRRLLVGGDGVGIGEFLSRPVEHWIAST